MHRANTSSFNFMQEKNCPTSLRKGLFQSRSRRRIILAFINIKMNCGQEFAIFSMHLLVRLQSYILAPILPLEVKRRGINEIIIGVIMSAYSFSFFFVPPLVKKVLFPRI